MSLVWAQDRHGAIGKSNTIPWRVPEDMAHFREVTGSDPVIMGRKTWESLPEKFRPLPGRDNIVITRNANYDAPGAQVVHTLGDALAAVAGDVTVMGGGDIYALAMAEGTRLWVTHIDVTVEAPDSWAPPIDPAQWEIDGDGDWQTSRTDIGYRFVTHRRRGSNGADGTRPAGS